MALETGTILNKTYRVVRLLGKGGMGNIYLVERLDDDKRFVIKELILSERIDISKQREIFLREAGFMAKFNHEGIPKIYEVFGQGEKDYIVMDYIQGQTLEEFINKSPGPLPAYESIRWVRELCEIIDYLHNSFHTPIVYRDLKPANIIITPGGKPMLVDFGIARYYNPDKDTDTVSYGSPGYAAPEQYKGKGQSSPQSDIFGLGVILFQMLTRYDPTIKPFIFPSMKSLNPSIPDKLENIVKRAIQLDPLKRYISIQEFKEALEKYSGIGRTLPQVNENFRQKPRFGLSLIEFMIIIAIIAVIAAIILPNFVKTSSPSPLAGCQSNIRNLATALEMYATDYNGTYPPRLDALTNIGSSMTQRYIRKIPECWSSRSTSYHYIFNNSRNNYTIYCPSAGAHSRVKKEYSGVNYPQYSPTKGLILP